LSIKNKRNKFINIIIALVSLTIVVFLCMFLLDATGKINQGSFRVSDLVVSSIATVEDNQAKKETTDITTETTAPVVENTIKSFSDIKLDVSQKNAINILIAKSNDIEAKDIYIDNVSINYPVLTENMFLYQKEENKIDLKTEKIKLSLEKEDKDGQYLIKINIDNINCVKQAVIPETTTETATSIVYDGTIFNVLNTKISDISFNVQFNLNIFDSTGRVNICKVKLYLPNELLVTNGMSIINENAGNFPFKIK